MESINFFEKKIAKLTGELSEKKKYLEILTNPKKPVFRDIGGDRIKKLIGDHNDKTIFSSEAGVYKIPAFQQVDGDTSVIKTPKGEYYGKIDSIFNTFVLNFIFNDIFTKYLYDHYNKYSSFFEITFKEIVEMNSVSISIANDPDHTFPVEVFKDYSLILFTNFIDTDAVLVRKLQTMYD